jgi:sortase A
MTPNDAENRNTEDLEYSQNSRGSRDSRDFHYPDLDARGYSDRREEQRLGEQRYEEQRSSGRHRAVRARGRSHSWEIFGVLGEIVLTLGILCALYIVWQLWWTGVVSAQTQAQQAQSISWTKPASSAGRYHIAQPQKGDPPVDSQPAYGDTIGQIYIPRFGRTWKRLVVQGVGLDQLARHGLGHYPETVMPGAIGNFSLAGHRSGYGEPLGNVPEFRPGDAIIMRTKDNWYVYTMKSYEIVLPTDVAVVAPVPGHPGQKPTQRLITLTTCTPRYTYATHRWIVHGTFKYWARVSDGIPAELAGGDTSAATDFVDQPSAAARIPSMVTMLTWLLAALIVVWLAAAITWGWQALRLDRLARRSGQTVYHHWSIYGLIYRLQPGVPVVRWILMILMGLILAGAFLQWVCPWMVVNIPILRTMSNYANVTAGTPATQ